MLLTYVDESYTKDRYYIAGLAVHHEDIRALENAITQIVADASKVYAGVGVTSELHGHELFHGKGDWKKRTPRQRIGVYNKVFQAISDHDAQILFTRARHPVAASPIRPVRSAP